MKLGKSLVELAKEVERQNNTKKDFIADTAALNMTVQFRADTNQDTGVRLDGLGQVPLDIRPAAHAQISTHTGIPKAYYDRMLAESPSLLAANVNTWLAKQPTKQMIRTLDGQVRGFLSSRYRAMDNFDLLQAALPVLTERKVEFKSCEITEKHMFLKVIFPELTTQVPGSKRVGDIVEAGLCLRNSEIGFSSFAVEPFFHFLVCTNGMISNAAQRKYHVGKRHESEAAVEEILRDETREARDRAFWMQIQDVIRSAVNRDVMMAHVERFGRTTQVKLDADPVKVVEVTRKEFALSEAMGGGILKHLVEGGDLSQWGLINAVTRTAQDQEDYEDATMLERLGGKIVELPQRDFAALLKKAS